jgi:hypothetical protein
MELLNMILADIVAPIKAFPPDFAYRHGFGAEILIPTANGFLAWTPDLRYPCVLEQPAKDEFEVVA